MMKRRRLFSDTGNCNPPEIDATKLPARRLLKTSDLPGPKDPKLWEEVLKELPVDILLLTVEVWEFLSCVSHLNPGYFRSCHANLGKVYFGLMGTGPTFLKIAVIKCHPGPLIPVNVLITLKNGVEMLRPKAVFCVGFCGGLGEKVSLGDVAILAKLRIYSSVKVTDSGIQECGIAVPLERNLLRLIKNAADGWKAPLRGSWEVEVWNDGVYLSGPEKVESKERREELVNRFPDAIAIDMDVPGLFSAAHDLEVKLIVIKGVANLADGKEPESWKQFASVMAASLTAHILRNPIVFENWPHYKGLSNTVPAEIRGRGPEAERALQKALQRNETVNVYRARVMIVGQERAGKTSLKKSLLGKEFNPKEESTVGIEVNPSKCEVEVDQVLKWEPIKDEKFKSEQIAMLIAKELNKTEALQAVTDLEENNKEEIDDVKPNGPESFSTATKSTADVKLKKNSSSSSADQDIHDQLNINTTAIPKEDVTESVIQYLQGRKLEDEIKAEEFVINLWDFAGQHVYYASHPVFLSPRAVYLLVYNLSKSLSAKAEPWVRQGATDRRLHNPNDETNLDNLLAWLVSVHSIRGADVGDDVKDADHQAKEKPGYLRPPVLIVGTHADQPFEDLKIMKKCIEKGISGKKYQQQVKRPFFYVDNTKSKSDRGVQELQNKIMTLFKEGSCKAEKLPLRWFHFEKVVETLVEKGKTWMKLDELSTVIKWVCHIEDEKELRTMLNFYHDLGVIVKHGHTLVLQAQWLIDLFKQLITVPPFEEVADSSFSDYWDKLEKSGILEIALVDHVFKDLIQEGHSKQDILDWMEIYGLIGKFTWESKDEEETKYFVPSQLNSPPSGLYKISPSESDPCPLYIHFPDGFVPHGLFSQLLSRCISWCSKYNCKRLPQLYCNGARLFIRMHSVFELVLICRKRFIKVVLRSPQQTGSSLTAASTEMANEVRTFLEATLKALTSELSWLWNLQCADLWPWVACSHCLQSDDQCTEHNSVSCSQDDCLHLLKVDLKEGLSCEKNFSSERVKVNGLEKWFEACKAQNEEDNLGYRGSVADDALLEMSADSEASHQSSAVSSNDNSNSKPPEIDLTKLPAGDLLQEKDLPEKRKPWNQVKLPVDALLLTVQKCEFLSCVSYLNPGFFRSCCKILGDVYFGEIGIGNTTKVALKRCPMGAGEPGSSGILLQYAVEQLNPKAVICVGICGGLNETELKLGDVAVLTKLKTFASVNVTERRTLFEVPLERNFLQLLTSSADGWHPPLTDKKVAVNVKNGVFLTGRGEVDDKKRPADLTEQFPDALAIEKEAEGLYIAAHNLKMEWAVIKGVSDFADGRKCDLWESFASVMAASLTAHVLSDPTAFEDWNRYRSPSTVEAPNSRLNDVVLSNSSQTRKRFRPTAHELSILQADHQLDYRSTLGERSREFGVTEKQILNWHKRYKTE